MSETFEPPNARKSKIFNSYIDKYIIIEQASLRHRRAMVLAFPNAVLACVVVLIEPKTFVAARVLQTPFASCGT